PLAVEVVLLAVVRVELNLVEVPQVWIVVGHAPGDAVGVTHNAEGEAGEGDPAELQIGRIQPDLIPGENTLPLQMGIGGEDGRATAAPRELIGARSRHQALRDLDQWKRDVGDLS